MSQDFYPVPASMHAAHANQAEYLRLYQWSIDKPDDFWQAQGKRIDWILPFTKVSQARFSKNDVEIKWYQDGTLNASYNCIDRHLGDNSQGTAIIWEGDEAQWDRSISYQDLHDEVCRLANGLKALGVEKGDRVIIYMPMVPEAAYAMLACARIGAVHSVVFAGFSATAIADRIEDCAAKVLITADQGRRAGNLIPLKENVDKALLKASTSSIETVLVYQHTQGRVNWIEGRDVWWHEQLASCSNRCQATEMNAEDPLFILYTSGSTGKPKGVVHTTGGYLVYASLSHHYVFDHKPEDIYWCAADVGWITGHTYIVYGPLANGATTLMFEGVPTYPDVRRIGQIIDKHKVTILYTAPTAIRALMAKGQYP
jgi:acetyl-CoA synthetase